MKGLGKYLFSMGAFFFFLSVLIKLIAVIYLIFGDLPRDVYENGSQAMDGRMIYYISTMVFGIGLMVWPKEKQ